jgi:microcystin-dependent protein
MAIQINGSGSITGLSAGGLPAGSVTSASLDSTAIYLTAPAGAVCFVCQSSAPTGWLKANGGAVSRTVYASLFAAIGTTFGSGDGSTTFNLPDLRGYFPRGYDDGAGVDSGRVFGSSQADDFKSHSHGISNTTGSSGGGSYGYLASGADNVQSSSKGGTETRPKNIALLACVKY